MQMRKPLLAGLAAGGLALGLVLGIWMGRPVPPKQVLVATPKASDPTVDETLRLLNEASATLSKVGPALDYPLLDS